MGLFHDTCTALIDTATHEALSGEALEAARALLHGVDENGNPVHLHGADAERVLATRGWGVCGNPVPKKARFCRVCGTGAPGGWVKCPACRRWVGNDARFCPHCNHPLHPDERVDIAGGIWDHAPGTFAQRFEVEEDARQLKEGLMIQEGTVAIFLDAGKEVRVLGPGRHTPAGTLRAINWFGNPPPRSVVLVSSGDRVFRVAFAGLRSAEELPIGATAEVTLRFRPSRAADFLANFLKERRSVSDEAVCDWLMGEMLSAAKDLALQSSVEDLVKDPDRRGRLEEALSRGLRDLLDRNGLDLVRVGAVEFLGPAYEAMRAKFAELEKARRELEFKRANLALIASEEESDLADAKAREERRAADGRDRASREADDAEFHARKEQEVAEFLAQLAQEKDLAGIDRSTEAQLALRVAAGKLARKDAELEAASRLERDAREMETLAHKLSLDLKLRDYNRDALLLDARAAARVGDVRREEREKDARSGALIDGIAAEAWAKRAETTGRGYEEYAKHVAAAQDAQNRAQTDHLARLVEIKARNAEIKAQADRERAGTVKGLSAIELAALHEGDAQARAAFLAQANAETLAALSKEQILAMQAGTSSAAASAYAEGEKARASAEAARAAADAAAFQRERNLFEKRVAEADAQRDSRIRHDEHLADAMAKIAELAVNHGEKTTFMQAQTWPEGGPVPGGQSVGSAPKAAPASFGGAQSAGFGSYAPPPVPPAPVPAAPAPKKAPVPPPAP